MKTYVFAALLAFTFQPASLLADTPPCPESAPLGSIRPSGDRVSVLIADPVYGCVWKIDRPLECRELREKHGSLAVLYGCKPPARAFGVAPKPKITCEQWLEIAANNTELQAVKLFSAFDLDSSYACTEGRYGLDWGRRIVMHSEHGPALLCILGREATLLEYLDSQAGVQAPTKNPPAPITGFTGMDTLRERDRLVREGVRPELCGRPPAPGGNLCPNRICERLPGADECSICPQDCQRPGDCQEPETPGECNGLCDRASDVTRCPEDCKPDDPPAEPPACPAVDGTACEAFIAPVRNQVDLLGSQVREVESKLATESARLAARDLELQVLRTERDGLQAALDFERQKPPLPVDLASMLRERRAAARGPGQRAAAGRAIRGACARFECPEDLRP